VTEADGVMYVITGGGEGLVRIWKFDRASSKFEMISTLEGHIREVTCLYLHGESCCARCWFGNGPTPLTCSPAARLSAESRLLWTGSVDRTIRVWELTSGRCVGTLNSASGGHTEAVTALELITTPPAAGAAGAVGDPYIVSAGADGELKVWSTNGEFMGSGSHGQVITALRAFQDGVGGQPALLVGLVDGSIAVRSCATLSLLFVIPSATCGTSTVWALEPLGQSCFASGGDDGQLIVWKIEMPLMDSSS
jgi:WD40 repeat protein